LTVLLVSSGPFSAGERLGDFFATALGLAFALIVCLLAVHAILGPWLRVRRSSSNRADEPETRPLHMV
jgi:hypothetical protein